ncbi:MAG: hypothetical protein ISQ46_04975 [Methylophilaceae bacterium]|nr:hypothetical protein [Methylophilaceae bacterium]
MADDRFFLEGKNFWWPSEYADIMQMLGGKNSKDEKTHPAMYKNNAYSVILAATIGLIHNRKADIGKNPLAIDTSIFDRNKLGNIPLSYFFGLIFLLSDEKNPEKNIEKFRDSDDNDDSNEEYMIKIVQQFTAGGLEYLRGSINEKGDLTGSLVLNNEALPFLKKIEKIIKDKPVDLNF